MRREHCTCSGYSFPDDGGICSYCERMIEEDEADARNEAHARDPAQEDYDCNCGMDFAADCILCGADIPAADGVREDDR